MRAVDAQHTGGEQGCGDFGGHAVRGIGLAFRRIPEMMSDEFQRQTLGRRPGQGPVGRRPRPALAISQVGGERPQAVFAQARLRQVLQRGDVLVGEDFGEPVALVHRQDRGERVELHGASRFGIGGEGARLK